MVLTFLKRRARGGVISPEPRVADPAAGARMIALIKSLARHRPGARLAHGQRRQRVVGVGGALVAARRVQRDRLGVALGDVLHQRQYGGARAEAAPRRAGRFQRDRLADAEGPASRLAGLDLVDVEAAQELAQPIAVRVHVEEPAHHLLAQRRGAEQRVELDELPLDLVVEGARTLVALVRVPGDGLLHHSSQRRRHVGPQRGDPEPRPGSQLRPGCRRLDGGAEALPGEELEEQHPRREDVSALVLAQAIQRLGRDVAEVAKHHVGLGVVGLERREGQPEVGELDSALVGHEDV